MQLDIQDRKLNRGPYLVIEIDIFIGRSEHRELSVLITLS